VDDQVPGLAAAAGLAEVVELEERGPGDQLAVVQRGWTQADIGARVNDSEALIAQVETGGDLPPRTVERPCQCAGPGTAAFRLWPADLRWVRSGRRLLT
jgi:hypothetical protein